MTYNSVDEVLEFLSHIEKFNATLGASASGSAILGRYGGELKIGVYLSCCGSPDFVVTLTTGRPAEHAPNIHIPKDLSVGGLLQGELYRVGADKLRGTGGTITFITPVVGVSADYEDGFTGNPIGYGIGRGAGWGITATDTRTRMLSLREQLMRLYELVGL